MPIVEQVYDRNDLAKMQEDANTLWVYPGQFHWAAYTMSIPGKFKVTIEFIEDENGNQQADAN